MHDTTDLASGLLTRDFENTMRNINRSKCFAALAASSSLLGATVASANGSSVLFIRGAERSGGFLESGSDADRTEQLADINNGSTSRGNHGWKTLADTLRDDGFTVNQWIEPLEANAPATGGTTGLGIDFTQTDLSPYDVIVFGSNNGVYTDASVDVIENYIRGGGGAIFISDANFGGDWADASNSDQQFLSRFGLIAHQDRGTYSISGSDLLIPDHPLLEGVDRFDGEGVTPIRVGELAEGVEVEILANAEGQTRLNEGDLGNLNIGPSRNAGPNDAALLAATIDEGRLVGHFDRNTFFNLNGAGTNITRFDNEQLALNIFRFTSVPEPGTATLVIAAALAIAGRRRRA